MSSDPCVEIKEVHYMIVILFLSVPIFLEYELTIYTSGNVIYILVSSEGGTLHDDPWRETLEANPKVDISLVTDTYRYIRNDSHFKL